MEDEIYKVKKNIPGRIEDNQTYQLYSNSIVEKVPYDDMSILLKIFFDKAAVNMGKESYDAPDAAREAILEFIFREFGTMPVFYIGSAIISGSLGKYGPGRLVPQTVYKWLNLVSQDFSRKEAHDKLKDYDYSDAMDLHSFPVGKAICKKIDLYEDGIIDIADWDRMPLKEIAERINSNLLIVPELWGITSKPKIKK